MTGKCQGSKGNNLGRPCKMLQNVTLCGKLRAIFLIQIKTNNHTLERTHSLANVLGRRTKQWKSTLEIEKNVFGASLKTSGNLKKKRKNEMGP